MSAAEKSRSDASRRRVLIADDDQLGEMRVRRVVAVLGLAGPVEGLKHHGLGLLDVNLGQGTEFRFGSATRRRQIVDR